MRILSVIVLFMLDYCIFDIFDIVNKYLLIGVYRIEFHGQFINKYIHRYFYCSFRFISNQ